LEQGLENTQLGAFHQLGYFEGIPLTDDMFMQDLNDFISDGRKPEVGRNRIAGSV
jgi:fumarylacetoacetase